MIVLSFEAKQSMVISEIVQLETTTITAYMCMHLDEAQVQSFLDYVKA